MKVLKFEELKFKAINSKSMEKQGLKVWSKGEISTLYHKPLINSRMVGMNALLLSLLFFFVDFIAYQMVQKWFVYSLLIHFS